MHRPSIYTSYTIKIRVGDFRTNENMARVNTLSYNHLKILREREIRDIANRLIVICVSSFSYKCYKINIFFFIIFLLFFYSYILSMLRLFA